MKSLFKEQFLFLLFLFLCIFLFISCKHEPAITLAERGTSDYRIVISSTPDASIEGAAFDFQKYFALVTGIELSIVRDTAIPKENEILVGFSNRIPELENEIKTLNEDGFIIRTSGNTLIIAGGQDKGTRYGVYTFFEEFMDCRKYSHDVEVIPPRDVVTIHSIDIKQEPAFEFRELHMPMASWDRGYRDWHKLDFKEGKNEWGLFVHTFDDFIPAQQFFYTHPEYFSYLNVGRIPDGQLCLSNTEVFRIVMDSLSAHMKRKPEALYWSVSQNDTYKPCECETCKSEYEEYGGYSGAMVHFVNRIAAEFPDKVISTLAYQYTRAAPANIKPAPNVNIMFCSIECNRSKPLVTDPSSASFRKDTEDWCKLTSNIFMWDYVVQFRNLVSPFPNLRVLQPNLQYFRDKGMQMMFQQGSGGLISEFVELRSYLIAKLLWDPDADVEALMEDFCYGYYGPAGEYILQYINTMHDALESTGGDLGIYGYPYDGINTYLTPERIDEYQQILNYAEKAVANNPDYLWRVQVARLPLEFAIIDISLRNVNDDLTMFRRDGETWTVRDDMLERLDRLTERALKAGVARYWEHGNYPGDYRNTVERYVRNSMQNHLALGKPVELMTESSPKYPVGGPAALTDGLKGINDYHFNWMGFEGPDLLAVIDLEAVKEIKKVELDFLQEIKSWVFLPVEVSISFSKDGEEFMGDRTLKNNVPLDQKGTFIETFLFEVEQVNARYIKIHAKNLGTCPDWHPGMGYPAWIFCDEVLVW
jgi:hypothetical protein